MMMSDKIEKKDTQTVKRCAQGRFTDGYIGTYYSQESKGIYHFLFNQITGEMTKPELFYEAPNAKWVSLYENRLAFPVEKDGKAGTCFLELEAGAVKSASEVLLEEHTPCYIAQDGNFVYTANYHDGTVMVYDVGKGTPAVVRRIENGRKAGCHQILLHETYMLVPCLEQHRIRVFDRVHDFCPAGEIVFPEGTGPRHGVFNKAHTKLYWVSEWSNELFIFEVSGCEFNLVQKLSLFQEGMPWEGEREKVSSAAIRLSGDERFLYISMRGAELLCVADVSGDEAVIVQYVPSGGVHPRDFILSNDGRYVLTANRMQGGIVCMERNSGNGKLGEIINRVYMPQGVSLVLARV